jgi:hypothetical protein
MEAVAKRKPGRPKGSKNSRPAKPRFTRKVSPETPPKSAYGASPAEIDEMVEDLAGNGRDETAYETASTPFSEAVKKGWQLEPEPVLPASPALTKLFVTAVENGYLIRPADSQGEQIASLHDTRSWVVTSREELAAMVTWLVAERGATSPPDMLGGARTMPQPTSPHYAPPQVLEEADGA